MTSIDATLLGSIDTMLSSVDGGVACGSLATLLLRLANWLVRRGAVRLAAVGNGEPEREFHVANGYGGQVQLAQHSRLAILLGERFGEEVSLVLR